MWFSNRFTCPYYLSPLHPPPTPPLLTPPPYTHSPHTMPTHQEVLPSYLPQQCLPKRTTIPTPSSLPTQTTAMAIRRHQQWHTENLMWHMEQKWVLKPAHSWERKISKLLNHFTTGQFRTCRSSISAIKFFLSSTIHQLFINWNCPKPLVSCIKGKIFLKLSIF